MLDSITFGTFLVFGCACIAMVVYAIICVPETKGVPLESIYLLFENNIIAGAIRDTIPKHSRAKGLQHASNVEHDPDTKGSFSAHVEQVDEENERGRNGAAGSSRAA